jgi:outer membrane protein TolC
MEYLIGKAFSRLIEEEVPRESGDLLSLSRKADERPDVVAARESFTAYKSNIAVARSSFFPSVTLAANGYTKRSDIYDGNDWDATLSVNVPLFNGLDDAGDVAQARSQARQADFKLSQVRRKALLEVRNAAVKLDTARRRVDALALAVDAFQKNYDLQAEDFSRNLVNNLEVLQALEDLQGARRELVYVRAEAARAYWALEVAAGGIN